jgi:hypothetical protein
MPEPPKVVIARRSSTASAASTLPDRRRGVTSEMIELSGLATTGKPISSAASSACAELWQMTVGGELRP